ncbi:hypothetical protein NQ317_017280 [Molorchus minor]|uniref:Uncharacterized protein n=1 Tax=Molorchus minor TaxID=1323400 RepID=A0ABQ9JU35_9CUCU|nr:hypothetical protein NQ317_017280 [Molorchus minor]
MTLSPEAWIWGVVTFFLSVIYVTCPRNKFYGNVEVLIEKKDILIYIKTKFAIFLQLVFDPPAISKNKQDFRLYTRKKYNAPLGRDDLYEFKLHDNETVSFSWLECYSHVMKSGAEHPVRNSMVSMLLHPIVVIVRFWPHKILITKLLNVSPGVTAVVTAPKSRSSAGWFSLQFDIEETGSKLVKVVLKKTCLSGVKNCGISCGSGTDIVLKHNC